MKISRERESRKLWLSQKRYFESVLKRFGMLDAKLVSIPLAAHFKIAVEMCPRNDEEVYAMSQVPYSSVVGSLMYAMVCTRSDIAHAMGVVSRYMSNLGKQHWVAVKWILRYIKGTLDHALCFGNTEEVMTGFVDADIPGDLDGRKSTTGYIFTFAGAAISWVPRLQKVVALSTTEAEYIAATEACKELIWLQRLMGELGTEQGSFKLFCDSQSVIHLAKNAAFHSRTKHIDLRYHIISQVLEEGQVQLEKISTEENPTDMMTKSLSRDKLKLCASLAGLEST